MGGIQMNIKLNHSIITIGIISSIILAATNYFFGTLFNSQGVTSDKALLYNSIIIFILSVVIILFLFYSISKKFFMFPK